MRIGFYWLSIRIYVYRDISILYIPRASFREQEEKPSLLLTDFHFNEFRTQHNLIVCAYPSPFSLRWCYLAW